MNTVPRVEGQILLCDAAQEVGGKLYVLGGGWSRVVSPGPFNMALAVKLGIPWHLANTRLKVMIALLDQDGGAVHNEKQLPIRVEVQVEVGRPPGLSAGTTLDWAMAISVPGLSVAFGGYRWELTIDGELVTAATFEVLAPPSRQ